MTAPRRRDFLRDTTGKLVAPRAQGAVQNVADGAGAVDLPEHLLRLLGDAPHRVVWTNMVGGCTVAVGDGDGETYLKWAPRECGIDLAAEVERLAWAGRFIAVPRVLEAGGDEVATWFWSASLHVNNAISPECCARPADTARELGRALRHLHDHLPVRECPYSWDAESRLAAVRGRVATGLLQDHDFAEWFPGLDLPGALEELARVPTIDLVVCHGDPCAPNTLIDEFGRFVGHLDMGALGLGDRWADLAVLAWSTIWNFGEGYEQAAYEGYGVAPDDEKIRYYRLMWELR